MEFKPLICLPSPRDIEIVMNAVDAIRIKHHVDVLWVKYTSPERCAYKILRDFFLAGYIQNNWTHLAIWPDDLLVSMEQWEILCDDIRIHNYPIICGMCNIDSTEQHRGLYNVCPDMVVDARLEERHYLWLSESDYKVSEKPGIYRVYFAGFPLMFIEHSIVKHIPFRDDRWFDLNQGGCCIDVMFCYDCFYLNYPIYCDTRVKLEHLKKQDAVYDNWGIGSKKPTTIFQSGSGERRI